MQKPKTEIEIQKYYDLQDKIVLLKAKGLTVNDIQRETGLSRKEVENFISEFREYAKQDKVIRERSKEIVLTVDQHYNEIIKSLHRNVEEANLNDDYKSSMTGLKMIADAEAKRVDLLAKAGILADSTLSDQIAEAEEKQQILIDILRDIAIKYPQIAKEISDRLSKASGRTEALRVVE